MSKKEEIGLTNSVGYETPRPVYALPPEHVEPPDSLEEKLLNIVGELEARIEQLEKDSKKLKSGLPQLGW